jgi:hypothetical protein
MIQINSVLFYHSKGCRFLSLVFNFFTLTVFEDNILNK